jgi:diacylglycerol kinase (ATP)
VSVANTTMIGGGMRVAPNADPTDGLFDVVIAEGVTPFEVLRVFPRLYSGTHLSHRKVHVFRSATVSLEPTDSGVPPPLTCADGEIIAPWPVRLRCHKAALRILA